MIQSFYRVEFRPMAGVYKLEIRNMKPKNARTLSASAQEALRYRVFKAVKLGMSKPKEGRVFSISRTAPYIIGPKQQFKEVSSLNSHLGPSSIPYKKDALVKLPSSCTLL